MICGAIKCEYKIYFKGIESILEIVERYLVVKGLSKKEN